MTHDDHRDRWRTEHWNRSPHGPFGRLDLSDEEFEEAVADALDQVPAQLTDLMDNVALFIVDEPEGDDPNLLGLYEGTPLTERDLSWGGTLPDRISIYRGPLLRFCRDRDELIEEVTVTVVHEIAHHFGIEDEALHRLGWG